MRPLFTLSFLLIAALCFTAGYTIGKKHESTAVLSETPRSSESKSTTPTATAAATKPSVVSENILTTPATPPEASIVSDAEKFSQRAQQNIITLTDNNDRALVGKLLEASEENLKVLRQVDNLVLNVPITMLCPEDKAFAAYLYEHKKGNSRTASISDSDKIWKELFN
jgi:hypothetical protein